MFRIVSPFRAWLLAALSLFVFLCAAGARAEDEFLDPLVAFKFSAKVVDGKAVAVTFDIADGYYMYRERFKFAADGATLGTPQIPPGKVKYDETFAKDVETYRRQVTITIPVEAPGPFTLKVTSQGCSDKGLCYSPMESSARLMAVGGAASAPGGLLALGAEQGASNGAQSVPGAAPALDTAATVAAPATASAATGITTAIEGAAAPASQSEMGRIESALKGGSLLVIAPLFILLGLGLSFTPCVLPMVPILSSIIVGDGAAGNRSRGFVLSLSYSLGMAIVYTALGIAAGLIGQGLAAALQNPWVLGTVGLLMAGMSLSMFGVFELQVPAALQSRLASASNRQSGGKLAGVFAMGAISALIVGPCVAAPLAGALVYISQTRDVVVGGSALFSMAVGMSIPLLLVGLSAGALLPRAGLWMQAVKRFFGVLMLVMAWWLVAPVLPGKVQMIGWAILGVGYAFFLLTHENGKWVPKVIAAVFAVFGLLQIAGLMTGSADPSHPVEKLLGRAERHLEFKRIKTVADLDAILAQTGGKTVMLDFYADWCVSCKEMEKLTFVDAMVQQKLANTILLQADVTANDDADKAMLQRFNLFGPPGIIMFNAAGQEIPDSRVIGFQNTEKFLRSLEKLK
ncbi:protein-disulfide reductase DsbD [Pseudoduganella sp. DS3]|uniref:Thiol:disulfide interchange protein DsbD n=1 Tax=Pseudoduganella guangdongensis TaxID=2692179 RepID=A0A6N9HHS8_9BURK|nr:protein-disulfide reductase DsbD [Pseudoduganella guangdongensis]MYN02837.1 protein-disulfide reductase DsbD [Pseudoduganella guangdongensis]